jgi:hypothetical protein
MHHPVRLPWVAAAILGALLPPAAAAAAPSGTAAPSLPSFGERVDVRLGAPVVGERQ